jgi:hypothetical protein
VKKFMVIDMGGGTVDMTLHKSLGRGDLMLAEVTHRECLPEVSWQCCLPDKACIGLTA